MSTLTHIHFSIAALQSIICIGCLLVSVHNLFLVRKRQRRVERWSICEVVRICTLLGVTLFTISSIAQSCLFWSWETCQEMSIYSAVLGFVIMFCWSSGQFCSYLAFLYRLIDTFSESTYSVSSTTIMYLVILLILYEVAWIVQCVANITYWLPGLMYGAFKHKELVNRIDHSMDISILILDVLITVSMMYMFVSRLFAVMRGQTQFVNDPVAQREALNRSLDVDQSNYKLMRLSIKIAVLSITSLVSSLILVSFNEAVLYLPRCPHVDFNLAQLFDLCLQTDTIISCLCLTLFLARIESVYRVLCCCCSAVGFRWMRRVLLRRRDEIASSLQSTSESSIRVISGRTNNSNAAEDPDVIKSRSEKAKEPYPLEDIS